MKRKKKQGEGSSQLVNEAVYRFAPPTCTMTIAFLLFRARFSPLLPICTLSRMGSQRGKKTPPSSRTRGRVKKVTCLPEPRTPEVFFSVCVRALRLPKGFLLQDAGCPRGRVNPSLSPFFFLALSSPPFCSLSPWPSVFAISPPTKSAVTDVSVKRLFCSARACPPLSRVDDSNSGRRCLTSPRLTGIKDLGNSCDRPGKSLFFSSCQDANPGRGERDEIRDEQVSSPRPTFRGFY